MLLRLPILAARFLHNGRLRLLFGILILILIGGLCYIYTWENEYYPCFMEGKGMTTQQATVEDADSSILEDVLQAEPKPTPGRSIFFHYFAIWVMGVTGVYRSLRALRRRIHNAFVK